jgi:hypothetical protein
MGEAAPAPLRGAGPHPALRATFSRSRGRRESGDLGNAQYTRFCGAMYSISFDRV